MDKLIEAELEIEKKMVKKQLPKVMHLYALDLDHFVITVKSVEQERRALVKARVEVIPQEDRYILKIPRRVFEFYRLDENEYTVMVSEKEPINIIVSI